MTARAGSFALVARHPEARLFALMVFLVGLGVEVSRVAQTTFFLQNAGADQLPLVFVAFAAAMGLASMAYARAARQVQLSRLTSIAMAAAVTVTGVAWVCILTGRTSVLLAYALYCGVEMCFIFLPLTIWAVANQSFSSDDAELYLPPVAACGLVGALIGGLLSRAGVGFVGPYNTLPLAVVAYAVCFLLARGMPRLQRPAAVDSGARPPRPLLSEPLVVTLTLLSLPMFFLAYLIEFMYYSTMGQTVTDATQLSQFISTFSMICSVAAVCAQVWLTPLFFRRLGVGTTAFVYPAALALGAVLALIYALYLGGRGLDAGPPSLSFAFFVLSARALDIVLYQSVYDSTTNILYYAVPPSSRTRARSLVGGIMFPISVACSGLLLLSFKYFDQPLYNVAFAGIVVGFLVLVMGMDVRPDYLRSLLANSDDANVKAREALMDEISRLSLNESRVLLLESLQTEREDEALFAVEKLLDTYDHFLLEDLQEIKAKVRPTVLAALVNAMSSRGISKEDCLSLA